MTRRKIEALRVALEDAAILATELMSEIEHASDEPMDGNEAWAFDTLVETETQTRRTLAELADFHLLNEVI